MVFATSWKRMGSLDPNSISMKPPDPENFSKECSTVLNFIAKYYRDIEKYNVRSEVEPGYLSKVMRDSPPYFPKSLETILEEITAKIVPGLTHWQSPGFFAYFPGTTSTAGFVGEMLCNGFNTVGFNWISSPAATELESIVMDWFGKMLQLPTFFLFSEGQGGGGVLHGSTTESAICTLVAARDRALKKTGSHESITKLVVYASDQTHFVVYKAAKIIGIPCANHRVISTYASSEYSLNAIDVRSAIEIDVANGLIPLYLCATIGTTAIGAADSLVKLGQVAKDYGLWFHVDAAYAGSACICPEFRHYLNGIEFADSLCISAHKWLLTNLDCTCLWVKNSSLLTDSLSMNPEYLCNKASEMKQVVEYKDWQLALNRRFRALKLWMVIQRYGVLNLMQHIRSDVAMAKHFEMMVRLDERFEVVVPCKFSLVCFRVRSGNDEDNRRVMDEVNCSGKVFVTHAVLDGVFVIRFAVGGTLTELRHVDDAWELIRRKADDVLAYTVTKTWSTRDG